MVKVSVFRNKDSDILGMKIKGHAKSDVHGKDIVCSAVSALSYTAVGALLNLAGGSDYEEKNGYMSFFVMEGLTEKNREAAKIILETIFIGLKLIENNYGKFLKIHEEEV